MSTAGLITCLLLLCACIMPVHGQEEETNVALQAICCASSPSNKCGNAVDGNNTTHYSSENGGVDVLVQLQFDQMYLVRRINIMDLRGADGKIRKLQLRFTDGSTQSVTLGDFGYGLYWNSFDLNPVVTSDLWLTVTSVYTASNNGFSEIEVFGVPALSPYPAGHSCPPKLTGSLDPPNLMTWDLFFHHRMCFINCMQTPGCVGVAVNVHNNRCMVVAADCLLNKVSRINHIIWRTRS